MAEKVLDGVTSQVAAGTLLVKENDVSRKMYIIKKGKVRVFKHYLGQRVTLAILGEGEVFGELSFFDAEPRSASVEALTDLSVIEIDGAVARGQISALPDWIFPLFRTVFHRFREADRKLTVLQSMNEYQKKSFKTDAVAQNIYHELHRFLKALTIVFDREVKAGSAPSELIYKELDEILGNRILGLRVFWRVLKEFDFMDNEKEELEGKVLLNRKAIEELTSYLTGEIQSGRYLFLSHSAVAVLGRLVSHSPQEAKAPEQDSSPSVTVNLQELQLRTMPFHGEAIKELAGIGLLQRDAQNLNFVPARIAPVYTYQSVVKSFDHTIVNTD
ncbi:MAG: cyclic nucleotide-binding domain-containing protein [Oligoflexia bacterium]|nr:cyclic nucleotide-binding domain-containing protein [Oligoflexia bacterium]